MSTMYDDAGGMVQVGVGNHRDPLTADDAAARTELANVIRTAIGLAGLTQKVAAAEAGISEHTLESWLGGVRNPSVVAVARLLAVCGFRLRLALDTRSGS